MNIVGPTDHEYTIYHNKFNGIREAGKTFYIIVHGPHSRSFCAICVQIKVSYTLQVYNRLSIINASHFGCFFTFSLTLRFLCKSRFHLCSSYDTGIGI